MDAIQIKNTLKDQKDFLGKNFFVEKIGVFGSVAKNQDKESSDIDLMVEFARPIGFFQFARIENYLGNVLKKDVDLVTKGALKPAIKDEVLKEVVYV